MLPLPSFERDKLVRAELSQRFDELSEAERTRLLDRAWLTVARHDHVASASEAYVTLARKRVPFVITLDVLFAVAFRAVECALDELDRDVIDPALMSVLRAMSEKLSAESRAARSDTAEPYAIARAVVLVGRALVDPAAEIPIDLRERVTAEVGRIQAHAGFAKSPVLGRTLDYGAFDLQAGLAFGDERIGRFRALTWLARAALALVTEPHVDVGLARTHTRAAMLLTRALVPFEHDRWTVLADTLRFVVGPNDDPGPRELGARATGLGVELREEASLVNVVNVDHLRTALARDATPTVEDTGARMPTFRVLSPSGPIDARALFMLGEAAPQLPTALGVGVALGSSEARALLETAGIATKVLDEMAGILPTDPAVRHGSLHASALDALATYLAPSVLDSQRAWRESAAHRRRKLSVVLAAWTTLRHADVPETHRSARAVLDDPMVAFDDVPAAIEPHPEAIAKLLAYARQARRGLAARGTLHGAADPLLERVEALLVDAIDVVLSQARGALTAAQMHTLASMPWRIGAIERRLGPAAAPLVVATVADATSGQIREHATGYVDDVWLAVDVGGTATLYVGTAIPFYEMTSTLRFTDALWTKQLTDAPAPRPDWLE
jgi:hypothetical protein